jgi:hypothetical protein
MKSNSYNKAMALTLVAAATALAAFWPVTAYSQNSSRRDRFRRDAQGGMNQGRPGSGRPEASAQPGSTRPDSARRDASTQSGSSKLQAAPTGAPGQTGRITGPAEPDAAAKPVERRPPRRVVQDEQWTPFEIISQRNMFSRQRVPFRPRDDTPPPPRVMPNPESYFLLKGVTQENNLFIAFVEDKQSGSVLRLHEGDRVARGTVKSLNLDVLEYQLGDKTVTVNMGFDLEGGRGAVTAGDLASYSPTVAPAASGSSSGQQALPAADEAEILKRLMEQRKQQGG